MNWSSISCSRKGVRSAPYFPPSQSQYASSRHTIFRHEVNVCSDLATNTGIAGIPGRLRPGITRKLSTDHCRYPNTTRTSISTRRCIFSGYLSDSSLQVSLDLYKLNALKNIRNDITIHACFVVLSGYSFVSTPFLDHDCHFRITMFRYCFFIQSRPLKHIKADSYIGYAASLSTNHDCHLYAIQTAWETILTEFNHTIHHKLKKNSRTSISITASTSYFKITLQSMNTQNTPFLLGFSVNTSLLIINPGALILWQVARWRNEITMNTNK